MGWGYILLFFAIREMHVLKLKVLCGRIRVFVVCVFPVETFMQRPVCPGGRKTLRFCFMWVSRPFGSWGYIRQTRINMLKDVVSMFKGNVHWSGIMLWPDRWSTDTWQHAFRSRKNGQDLQTAALVGCMLVPILRCQNTECIAVCFVWIWIVTDQSGYPCWSLST